jgi:hypothetical protein
VAILQFYFIEKINFSHPLTFVYYEPVPNSANRYADMTRNEGYSRKIRLSDMMGYSRDNDIREFYFVPSIDFAYESRFGDYELKHNTKYVFEKHLKCRTVARTEEKLCYLPRISINTIKNLPSLYYIQGKYGYPLDRYSATILSDSEKKYLFDLNFSYFGAAGALISSCLDKLISDMSYRKISLIVHSEIKSY